MSAIAIVGIGCRFPGGIDDPASFWDLVLHKGDGIIEVPPDRWNLAKFYDPDPAAPGRMYVRHGGFLTRSLWDFDADFFGISPREAAIMDPQQRLLLEVAWEALDDAGMAGRVGGREVGVFVGGFMNDNALVRSGALARAAINSHSPTSASHTLLSARIAFLLDLLGPTLTIDTACSSSLVALHQAVLALEAGECAAALVGGANAMLRPEAYISMCKGRFLSVDGRCKTFDAAADGYGRGEGAGAILLKPLEVALREGDRVYAVVRGSGVNQDGRTLAIPVPNPQAQQALARRVHRLADVEPHQIGYVEAHGTGTAVGDPLEMHALGTVYGAVPGRTDALAVGSVKNNIGHTEAAAGVAGVIKAALTLHHATIAPQFRLDTPNPEIRFDELRLRVPLEPAPLPRIDGRAVVAVNSFGYGGTNAHAVLEQAPAPLPTKHTRPQPFPVLPLSARNDTALRELAGSIGTLAETTTTTLLTEAAWTRRAHHPLRAAFAYRDGDDLRAQLTEFAGGGGQTASRASADLGTDPVFVYSGMGPQWWGMGRGLLRAGGRFAAVAHEIDAVFGPIAGWSIIAELLRDEADSRITGTAFAQPANFLVQVALTAELAELGIRPRAVLGHSVGEVSAAYVSGALSLHDALLVSYHRSRLQATTAGRGGMLAVGLPEQAALRRIEDLDGVCVAAVNSATAVTLAGELGVLEQLRESLTAADIFAKPLRVEVPYHSHLMDPILDELRSVLAGLRPTVARIPLWSTVTGTELAGTEWDREYWCRNVREPVRFAAAVGGLLEAGNLGFLEVGPHPVLRGNIREALTQRGLSGAALSTLSRDCDDVDSLRRVVGDLYRAGVLDISRAPGAADAPVEHLDLPRYPWQRRTLWTEDPATRHDRFGATAGFAMLGERTGASAPEWEVQLSVTTLPWLRDHVVEGSVVLPGAAYLDAALSVVAVRTGRTSFGLEGVEFAAPLIVGAHDVPVVRLTVEETTRRFTVRSRAATETTWTVNAFGRLVEADGTPRTVGVAAPADAVDIPVDLLYAGLAEHGLVYGPSFRLVHSAHVGVDGVLARLDLAALPQVSTTASAHLVHPAVIDAALQCFAALSARSAGDTPVVVVPAAVASVRWSAPLPDDEVWVRVSRAPADPLRADIHLADATGRVALSMTGVRFARISARQDSVEQLDQVFYEPVWSIVDDADPGIDTDAAEYLLVLSLGSTISQRAKELAAVRTSSELRTLGAEDDTAADRLLELLRAAHARPGVEQSRVVVVANSELDPVHNVYALILVAQAISRLFAENTDAPPELRAVVVTEHAFCLPVDRHANIPHAALTGARRTLLNELPQAQWRLVDAEAQTPATEVLAQVFAGDPLAARADEVALRAGACWAMHLRHTLRDQLANWDVARPLDPESSFRLEIPRSRLLSELSWRAVERVAPGPGEVEIRVDAVGLNYKDPLKILGVLTEKELAGTYFGVEIGMEGAGEVVRVGPGVTDVVPGDLMSLCSRGMLTRYLTIRPDDGATQRMDINRDKEFDPCHCSSALPLLTAEFTLGELARLRPGETVLVHGAAGGMGMAAVQVARRMGARGGAAPTAPAPRPPPPGGGGQDGLETRAGGGKSGGVGGGGMGWGGFGRGRGGQGGPGPPRRRGRSSGATCSER
ncbi:type I polyketide synthase [Nocardia brasiliensis]|uniref:type I polyketide synthase n=1 Tax=Nocardia brasiliensis TaxID=37326 RepID=UPI002455B117|nr:type I polyketide synthase [Nocardia brasiliensis]